MAPSVGSGRKSITHSTYQARVFTRGETNDITLYTVHRRHVEVGKGASFRSPVLYSVGKKVKRRRTGHLSPRIGVLIAHSMPNVKKVHLLNVLSI